MIHPPLIQTSIVMDARTELGAQRHQHLLGPPPQRLRGAAGHAVEGGGNHVLKPFLGVEAAHLGGLKCERAENVQ